VYGKTLHQSNKVNMENISCKQLPSYKQHSLVEQY